MGMGVGVGGWGVDTPCMQLLRLLLQYKTSKRSYLQIPHYPTPTPTPPPSRLIAVRPVKLIGSVQSLDRLGCRGNVRDDSAEIPFRSLLQEALVSGAGMGRDVHSLMLSIQHFFCRPRCRPPSKVPRRMVLERLSWCVTCPNHASFSLLAVARRGSCGPTRKLTLLRIHSFTNTVL